MLVEVFGLLNKVGLRVYGSGFRVDQQFDTRVYQNLGTKALCMCTVVALLWYTGSLNPKPSTLNPEP